MVIFTFFKNLGHTSINYGTDQIFEKSFYYNTINNKNTNKTKTMHQNQQLIQNFYDAFAKRDFATMQACYADDATFSDEAFKNLNASQVRNMWEMLIKRGKDLKIISKNISANDTEGEADWIATYTFTQTGGKVENHIHAKFTFKNGKIHTHLDSFDFYKWAKQALGFMGFLLGWTSFLQKKVQKTAMAQLDNYMQKKGV